MDVKTKKANFKTILIEKVSRKSLKVLNKRSLKELIDQVYEVEGFVGIYEMYVSTDGIPRFKIYVKAKGYDEPTRTEQSAEVVVITEKDLKDVKKTKTKNKK